MAPQGAPNLDIVVTDIDGTNLCSFQVKTRWEKGADGGWHMSQKHEQISHPRMFYAFVDLGTQIDESSSVFVLPSEVVSKVIRESHSAWLSQPGKNGHVRKDSNVRRFLPDYSKFLGPKSEFGSGWLRPYQEAWAAIEDQTS